MTETYLSGRTAIVTGGNRGIGRAIAEELTRRGAQVAVGSRSAVQHGGSAFSAALDVHESASVERFVAAVEDALGPADILVNCAGITAHELVEGHDETAWLDVIDANLSGPFRTIRATIGGMKQRGWGRIVNIASTAARSAVADHAAYCASKAGLIGLTKAVSVEGAPHGVTCVAVSPTWVETEMLRSSAAVMAKKAGRSLDAELAEIGKSNPQGRIVQPREIAALVAFLCSDFAPGLTMEDIQINAGAHW